jgi:hypothetical protein
LKTYVFYGTAGEDMGASMSEPAGGLTPYLELYAPLGQKLAEDWGTVEALLTYTLGSTGWHTLLASDHTGPDMGSFTLQLTVTAIEEEGRDKGVWKGPELLVAGSNPFANEATIRYALPESGRTTVRVCDVIGRTVCTLASGWHEAGEHTLRWQARDEDGEMVPSGVYLCTVEYGGLSESARLVHLR